MGKGKQAREGADKDRLIQGPKTERRLKKRKRNEGKNKCTRWNANLPKVQDKSNHEFWLFGSIFSPDLLYPQAGRGVFHNVYVFRLKFLCFYTSIFFKVKQTFFLREKHIYKKLHCAWLKLSKQTTASEISWTTSSDLVDSLELADAFSSRD